MVHGKQQQTYLEFLFFLSFATCRYAPISLEQRSSRRDSGPVEILGTRIESLDARHAIHPLHLKNYISGVSIRQEMFVNHNLFSLPTH